MVFTAIYSLFYRNDFFIHRSNTTNKKQLEYQRSSTVLLQLMYFARSIAADRQLHESSMSADLASPINKCSADQRSMYVDPGYVFVDRLDVTDGTDMYLFLAHSGHVVSGYSGHVKQGGGLI